MPVVLVPNVKAQSPRLTIGLPAGSCNVPKGFPLVASKALILPSPKLPTSKAFAKVPKLGGAIVLMPHRADLR